MATRFTHGLPSSSLNASLAEAVDLFVMNKFESCFQVCSRVINIAKLEPEQERNYEVVEASAALGIQALAETDSWDKAISFITDVYGTVDLCPPRIVQVCILLHAHVQEYLPCHNLVQIWLKNPLNLQHSLCSQVIRVYAHHILCPTGSYETLKQIVHSCEGLTDTEREALLQLPQTERYREAKKTSSICEYNSSASTSGGLFNVYQTEAEVQCRQGVVSAHGGVVEDNNKGFGRDVPTQSDSTFWRRKDYQAFVNGCRQIAQAIRLKCSLWSLNSKFGILVLGLLTILALLQTQSGDPVSSLSRFVVIWRLFIERIKGIFH